MSCDYCNHPVYECDTPMEAEECPYNRKSTKENEAMNNETKPEIRIELDEATAVAIVTLLNNHVMAMQAWITKLKRPFMPYHANMMANYPPPTLQSMLHIMKALATVQREMLPIAQQVAEKAKGQRVFSREE